MLAAAGKDSVGEWAPFAVGAAGALASATLLSRYVIGFDTSGQAK
jgi:hypothetical protein